VDFAPSEKANPTPFDTETNTSQWIIGNTFPFVVFGSFGAFWLTFGMTLTPYFNAQTAYTVAGGAAEDNLPGFDATFGFFQVWMGVLCFIYMICALRTNVVFVLIFTFLVPAFGLLTAAYWHLAKGNTAVAGNCQIAAGACTFVVCVCGWWIFTAIMLASLDFPFSLPGTCPFCNAANRCV
jgi:succinate-acetate transporter protein